MNMTLDLDLAQEAKALVALAFRNGPPSKTCMRECPARFAAAGRMSHISQMKR
jgi:hypothetical protein